MRALASAPAVLVSLVLACSGRVAGDGGESEDQDSNSTTTSTSNTTSTSTEDSSSQDSSSDDADTTDYGTDFVPDEDEGWTAKEDCSVFLQDCAEGEKCVTTLDPDYNVFRCVPVLGDKGVDEACTYAGRETGSDDCDANSHCWNLSEDENGVQTGVCVPFCEGTPDDPTCPGQGESCLGYECRIIGQTGYPFCVERCDPLAQDCGEGKACYYEGGYLDFFCGVVNVPGALGEVCDYSAECDVGLACVWGEYLPSCAGESCCTSFCLTGDDAGCEASWPGTICSEVLAPPLMDGCPTHGMCVTMSP